MPKSLDKLASVYNDTSMKTSPIEIVPVKAFRSGLSRSVVISRGKGRGRAPDHAAALVPVRIVTAGLHRLDDDDLEVLRETIAALGSLAGIDAGSQLAREAFGLLAKMDSGPYDPETVGRRNA